MANNKTHTIEYNDLIKNLILLLFLTVVTVFITSLELGAFTVTGALLIASTKVYFVLANFMHLKYESILLKILVAMVFVLFALIIVITFIDYAYR